MIDVDQIAESIASGLDLGLVELLTTVVFVAAAFFFVLFAFGVVFLVVCCVQAVSEARDSERTNGRLWLEVNPPTDCVEPAADARPSNTELFDPAGHQRRIWTFNLRHWTLAVSVNRIEKPA